MNLREEFEKIIGMNGYLKLCYFCEKDNMYKSFSLFEHACASYLNGAWSMFQELKRLN